MSALLPSWILALDHANPKNQTFLNDSIEIFETKKPSSLYRILSIPDGFVQRSDEWFRARLHLLSASDCAAVIGQNKHASYDDVMKKKLGLGKPFKSNVATQHGVKYEDVALKAFERITKIHVIPRDFGLVKHSKYPFIGASPDGITFEANPRLLEIKCPYYRVPKPGYIPEYYIPQMQQQMAVFNLDSCFYFEYWPSSTFQEERYLLTEIKREPLWLFTHLPKIQDFVNEMYKKRQKMIDDGTFECPIARKKRMEKEESEKELIISHREKYKRPLVPFLFVGDAKEVVVAKKEKVQEDFAFV